MIFLKKLPEKNFLLFVFCLMALVTRGKLRMEWTKRWGWVKRWRWDGTKRWDGDGLRDGDGYRKK